MTLEFALLWLSVLFPLVFSVGPGNLLCAVAGGAQGYRQSLPFILGLDSVYSSYSLIFGFGLGSIILQFPTALKVVQIIGAIYVAYLAYKFIGRRHIEAKQLPELRFKDGAISQALNVKGISIILTMYSQFLDADKALVPQVLGLTLALLLLNLFTHSVWALGGSWMASTFASERAVRLQSLIFGGMLFLVAGWLLIK